MSEQNPSWIADWNPEDEKFWESKGKFIARRNLIWSIAAEHIGFSVWAIWSIVATKLPQADFHYSTDQLFQLVALPGLIGAFTGPAFDANDIAGYLAAWADKRRN